MEMESKNYKRFQSGIMFLEKPSWNSLSGLGGAPPAALRASFFFNLLWHLPHPVVIVHLPIQAATTLKVSLMV